MQTFTKLFAITLFGATYVAADATIFFTGNTNCAGSGSTQTVPGDGACRQLGGINSAITTNVDPGCSGMTQLCFYMQIVSYSSLLHVVKDTQKQEREKVLVMLYFLMVTLTTFLTVTVYTDSSCSVDATLAGLDQCLTGAPLLSFSYNC